MDKEEAGRNLRFLLLQSQLVFNTFRLGAEELDLLAESWALALGPALDHCAAEDLTEAFKGHWREEKRFPLPRDILARLPGIRPAPFRLDPPRHKTDGLGCLVKHARKGDETARGLLAKASAGQLAQAELEAIIAETFGKKG